MGALSKLPSQACLSPSWRDEVNQRVAEHRSRKVASTPDAKAHLESHHGGSCRAAEAAARVAERYAKAPSYSEMLAAEARAAARAAEADSQAALQAHAAAESILAGIEAASAARSAHEFDGQGPFDASQTWEAAAEAPLPDTPPSPQAVKEQTLGVRWAPDFPVRGVPPETRATREPVLHRMSGEEWLEPASQAVAVLDSEEIEVIEPAQPIHANLIEFPRELVATRKVRPRRAAGQGAAVNEAGMQLSIFEVDPATISVQPAAAAEAAVAATSAWPAPQWSAIELEALPQQQLEEDEIAAATQAPAAPDLQSAPFNLRLMAHVVDGSLIVLALLAAVLASVNPRDLPGLREVELGAAAAFVVAAALYHGLFFTLAKATPGMKYAHIRLCTFENESPTRAQRWTRMGALCLSVLPVGLGLIWAIFDDDHLSWHDRLSRTYLRSY